MESFDDLFALCERAIEGTLDESGRLKLERLVLQDSNARRAYVEYMHQHAVLVERKSGAIAESQPLANRIRPRWRTSSRFLAPLAMVAGMVLGVGLGRIALTKDQVIATLETSAGAQWYGATMPTMAGSRLTPGRLRLASGVATIRFDSGARVILEDSSDIELLSSGECRLNWGSMVAIVAAPADTFTIKTGSSVVTARRGSVGIVANAEAGSQVTVFNGRAQARHTNTGRTFELRDGAGAVFDVKTAQAQQNKSPEIISTSESDIDRGDNLETITTAMGRGRTGYVQSGPKTWRQGISSWSSVLQVKNANSIDYRRIAYLTFDLATIKNKHLSKASLSLSMVPSGHGHAAFVPDADFSLYAVVDDAQDGWNPDTIEWYDAPGRLPGSEDMDPDKTIKIASFRIPQGVVVGDIPIASAALQERIQRDGNGLLTLVVVRDTMEVQDGGYVHGFAGNGYPAAAPPTLRLTVAEEPVP